MKINFRDFVDELEILIQNNQNYYHSKEENQKLRQKVQELEEDISTLLKAQAHERLREARNEESLVILARELMPLFGFTQGEDFDSRVREVLRKLRK